VYCTQAEGAWKQRLTQKILLELCHNRSSAFYINSKKTEIATAELNVELCAS